jgi:PKD repeat protein
MLWNAVGTYSVQAKLKELYYQYHETDWSDPHYITITNSGGGNQLPYASFTSTIVDPQTYEYKFDASNSYDPDGGLLTNYHWDFGDGQSTSGSDKKIVYHTYYQGYFHVILTVTDDEGTTDSEDKWITVGGGNQDPDPPTINGPGHTGETCRYYDFYAVATDPNPYNDLPLEYKWEWKLDSMFMDGIDWMVGNDHVSVMWMFPGNGLWVRCRVREQGLHYYESDWAYYNMKINSGVLLSDPGGPYNGVVGQQITFDGSGSTGENLEYWWDFDGDGGWEIRESTSPTASYAYTNSGVYTVKLRVVNQCGFDEIEATTATITSS